MTTNEPPPYPGEPDPSANQPGTGPLPSYGSTPEPPSGAYPPPPPGGYPPAPGGYGGAPQLNKMAMWSMIVGIVSVVLGLIGACGVIFGPVAIGLAIPARRQIADARGAQTGGGMATAGLVTGIVGSALSIVWIILIAADVLELPGV